MGVVSLSLSSRKKRKRTRRRLSVPVRDTPSYRAIPYRDSIAEGVSHALCLVVMCYRASIAEIPLLYWGTKIAHELFFLKLFGHHRDIPPKIPGYPAKKLVSLGFEGHTELCGPHPFTWKTPTPPEDIRTKKFGLGSFFLPDVRGGYRTSSAHASSRGIAPTLAMLRHSKPVLKGH